MPQQKVKVLFVCMGNICRSPTAEGVFKHLVNQQGMENQIEVDSAGTHAYHIGESPDRRAQSAATNRGIDLSYIRGRKFKAEDFEDFDYVLAMDDSNYAHMQALNEGTGNAEFSLFLDYAENVQEREVPDPYYGGDRGFERVLNLIQQASEGLLNHIKSQHF